MSGCPRCQQALVTAQVDEYTVQYCRECTGFWMRHGELMQVVDRSWRAVAEERAEAMEFHAPAGWKEERAYRCPACRAAMEKYGYMGLAAVQIDRCDKCDAVWLDANELQNMVLALAKENYRCQQREQGRVKYNDILTAGAMSAALARGPGASWLFKDEQMLDKVVPAALGLMMRLISLR